MDSEKQPEGFEGGGEVGGTRWWVLWRARIAWSTGCGAKTMNSVTLKRKKKTRWDELKSETEQYVYTHFHSCIIHKTQRWKEPKYSYMDERINKM